MNEEPGWRSASTASWNVYAAQSKTLLSGTPKFKVVKLSTSPMHVGDVCTLGLFCAAVPGTNRDILDFIDVAVDHSGLFHVAYTDDYSVGALVMANQTGGPSIGAGGH